MAENFPVSDYYAPLAWVQRYMIDWGHCGTKVLPIRAFTTIIRWFCTPEERLDQWEQAQQWMDPPGGGLSEQHHQNLHDLLACLVEVPCSIDRRKLGLFFAELHDGDLIDGGPTPGWIPVRARLRRPGAAYLWGKWNKHFPKRGPLWGFWMFPRRSIFIEQ
jgi:hypothetical protein